LAAELKKRFGIDPELQPGHKGVFDVEADGRKVFSKYETHRFPNPGEVEELLEALKP
jgi:selT/selW/selH-like putative selenoprotein